MTDSRTFTTPRASRLHAAAERAVEEGIEVRKVEGEDLWVAWNPAGRKCYRITMGGDGHAKCSCRDGQFGDPCKHVAALMTKLGTMPPPPKAEFPDRPMDGSEARALRGNWQPVVLAEHEQAARERRKGAGE